MTQFMSNSLFFGAAISLIAYEAGLLLKRKFKMAIFNPLLIAIIAVIAVLCLLHIDYDTYNQSGQYISYLLTPATVCLAVPLYQQMELLKKNLKAVKIGKRSKTSYKVKKLLPKKKYYVRMRPYTKSGSKTYYGKWSKVKSVKIK